MHNHPSSCLLDLPVFQVFPFLSRNWSSDGVNDVESKGAKIWKILASFLLDAFISFPPDCVKTPKLIPFAPTLPQLPDPQGPQNETVLRKEEKSNFLFPYL